MAQRDLDWQSSLDGELGPKETDRLLQALRESPEAEREYQRLKEVDSALRSLGSALPPPELRTEVMRHIRLRAALEGSTSTSRLRRWVGSVTAARPVFHMGLGFAAAILVLSPFILKSIQAPVDPGQVSGALADPEATPMTSLVIAGPGVSGELRATELGDATQLELRLSADRPLDLLLHGWSTGVASWHAQPAPEGGVEMAPGRLAINHSGSATYTIRFHPDAPVRAPVTLRVVQAGQILFEGELP